MYHVTCQLLLIFTKMNASIITIGDEILIGQILDTNSTYLAAELNKLGIKVLRAIAISDTEEAIIQTLNLSLSDSDIVLITGGLGPTKDDITKHALARFFNSKMIRHQPTLEKIEKRLTHLGVKLSEINRAQADVPEKCEIFKNNSGSAPGMLFRQGSSIVVAMPGVPYEMKDIMQSDVIPHIKENYELPARIHKTFLTVGVAESTLSDRLENYELQLPENFSLAYLPSPSRVRLRLSAFATNATELKNSFEFQSTKLSNELGNDLYGYNDDTLEQVVGNMLRKNALTIATAESCTGGNIAQIITSVPGASDYFLGGVVAYSNEIKEEILSVSEEDLKKYGAVSREVVEQMANNVKKLMKSDFGVATSGIAGPTGGTEEKPVGTVWIAVASPKRTLALKFNLGNNRERTVLRSTVAALNIVRKEINNLAEKTVNKV